MTPITTTAKLTIAGEAFSVTLEGRCTRGLGGRVVCELDSVWLDGADAKGCLEASAEQEFEGRLRSAYVERLARAQASQTDAWEGPDDAA